MAYGKWERENIELARLIRRRSAQKKRAENPERFRALERERPRRNGVKSKARAFLNNAVRYGRIFRPETCSECGSRTRITGHHEDYSKPLEVAWLCYLCHAKRHHKILSGGNHVDSQ